MMPQQHATLPAVMRWHYRMRAHGWSNALFASDAATATDEGIPDSPGAAIQVTAAARSIHYPLPATPTGTPASPAGAKLPGTTRDSATGFRTRSPHPRAAHFGGGRPDVHRGAVPPT